MIEAEFERLAPVPPRLGPDAVRKIDNDLRFEHRCGEWNADGHRSHVGRWEWDHRAGNDATRQQGPALLRIEMDPHAGGEQELEPVGLRELPDPLADDRGSLNGWWGRARLCARSPTSRRGSGGKPGGPRGKGEV
jgi:hypothetical protein